MFVGLYEREHEFGVMLEALDAAAGGRGAAVLLEGVAGIGKTSVLERVCGAARERGVRGGGRSRVGVGGVVRVGRGAAAVRAAAAQGCLPTRVTVRWPAPPRSLGRSCSPTRRRTPEASFGVLHGLYWLVAALAEQRPQLLVVDDLQWSDDASARFLGFLANRLDTLPALLLAAERTGGTLRAAPLVRSIRLAPLSPAATAAVLGERDGGPVSEAFVEACHGATGGNPLLIRRLADGLHDAEGGRGCPPRALRGGERGRRVARAARAWVRSRSPAASPCSRRRRW